MKMKKNNERGSLALEQILFIGAVVLLAAGLGAFYTNLGNYFSSFDFTTGVSEVPVIE